MVKEATPTGCLATLGNIGYQHLCRNFTSCFTPGSLLHA